MNLFNRKVRKASGQLAMPSMPSISSMSPIRMRKDKELYKCYYCKGAINRLSSHYQEEDSSNLYHTKCLTCHECKQDCSAEFYYTFKKFNKIYLPTIYCKKDMMERCQSCGESIEQGGLVTFLGNKYHEEHFRCAECNEVLSLAEEVFEFKKKLYCAKDFVNEYKKEQLNQRMFLQNRQMSRKSKNSVSSGENRNRSYGSSDNGDANGEAAAYVGDYDDSYYDEEGEFDEEAKGDEDLLFSANNLDVRDFKNNEYSAKYCGGCSTMLLAGTNINEMRFRNSNHREYWHLDCFLLFKKYKIILSPKFLDPRRYIMFNKNASNINLNTDLRNISQWLNLFFEKIETDFNSLGKLLNAKNQKSVFIVLKRLLSQIQTLFNAIQDMEFIIEDYQCILRHYQFSNEFENEINKEQGNSLEKLNFSRYRNLKDKHVKIYSLFEEFLASDMTEYDLSDFITSLLKAIHHIMAFSLHKILIYNYLTKENRLLLLFLSKINAEIVLADEDDNEGREEEGKEEGEEKEKEEEERGDEEEEIEQSERYREGSGEIKERFQREDVTDLEELINKELSELSELVSHNTNKSSSSGLDGESHTAVSSEQLKANDCYANEAYLDSNSISDGSHTVTAKGNHPAPQDAKNGSINGSISSSRTATSKDSINGSISSSRTATNKDSILTHDSTNGHANGSVPENKDADSLYLDPKCSKCNQEIKLESFIVQMPNDEEEPKLFRFHMSCIDLKDIGFTSNVPNIIDAYGAGPLSDLKTSYVHTEYVSAFDQIIDSAKRLLKRWYSRKTAKSLASSTA